MPIRTCFRLAALVLSLGAAVFVSGTTAFGGDAIEPAPADEQDPQQVERAAHEAAAALDLVATEFNELFPSHGIWLYTEYSRPGYEQYRTKQWQKFSGNFQKTGGVYEQPGFCETELFQNGTSNGKYVESTTHRFSLEKGKVMLTAIHVAAGGNQNVYGPSTVERLGNGLEFKETSTFVAVGNWTFSTFFRTRDGRLSSERHWNAPYVDVWSIEQPPGEEKKP